METLTYWVTRLEPLIRSENQDEIIVVFCNRTGTEDEATYTGTSAVLGIQDGEVRVYGMLGRGEKSLLVVDTNNPPRAKMVYRPEGESAAEEQASSEYHHSQNLNPGISRPQTASPAPSTVRASGRQAVPLSPRPPIPPPAPPRGSSQHRNSSQSKREQATSQRREMTIQTSRPDDDDDGGIPTPSAPSPTPMAMRPKIIIPDSAKSPNSTAMDDFSEPPSAISLRSQDSGMSNRSYASNLSKASESTVRSLTRAPEDSTPYPHSGIPRSEPFSPDRKIFGGSVTFENPREETIGRKSWWSPSPARPKTPEAFPWPPVYQSSGGFGEADSRVNPWDQVRQRDNASSQSRDRKAVARKSNASLDSELASKFYIPGQQQISTSRTASRNQLIEGSPITTNGMMDPLVSFAQQTAHLIPGADAAERIRGIAASDSPIPERPSSPKSRNASRSRPTASPELRRRGTASPEMQRSHSAAIQIYASPGVLGSKSDETETRGRPVESTADAPQPGPAARSNSVSVDVRNSGNSSSSNEATRPPSRASQQLSRTDRRPSQSQRRPSVQDHDFERIEEIVSGNCPVHGTASRTASVSETHEVTTMPAIATTATPVTTSPESEAAATAATATTAPPPATAATPVPVT